MQRRRTSPALTLAALVSIIVASVAGGWFIAAQVADGESVMVVVAADPSEPTYDAGDPMDAEPLPPVAELQPEAPPPTLPADVIEPAAARTPSSTPRRTNDAGSVASPSPVTPETASTTDPQPEPSTTPSAPEPKSPPAPRAPAPPKAPPAPKAPAPKAKADPGPVLAPYDPPPAIGIAAEALPAEGQAWTLLTAMRRRAAAGSQERADLDWLIGFARSAASPGAPQGRQATARRALRVNAWWYQRRAAPGERVIARDPDGVILTYKRGHGFMVNPVATIGRWRDLNDAWTPAQLAESLLPMLAGRANGQIDWAALEYFDVPGEPSAVRPGVSGMAQARATSLYAKAWATTSDPRFLDAAQRTMKAFTVPVDSGGVLGKVRDSAGGESGVWYPERAYPGEDGWKGGALNGFMVTIIELERAATAFGDAPEAAEAAQQARDLAERARRSLKRFLPLHDTGSWSYYGLLTPGKPWRTYLADLNYHCYHVSLLRTLDGLHPEDGLGAVASRWQGYVDARGATCPER